MEAVLFGVKPTDALTFALGSLALVAVAALGLLLPRTTSNEGESDHGDEKRVRNPLGWEWRYVEVEQVRKGASPLPDLFFSQPVLFPSILLPKCAMRPAMLCRRRSTTALPSNCITLANSSDGYGF